MPPDQIGANPVIGSGLLIIFLFFGCFLGWAALAPLDSAAVASGSLIVDSNRKTVQHLEGGIVRNFFIRDGDKVKTGQVLIRLDEAQTRSNFDILNVRRMAALALEARLLAERDSKKKIIFPKALLGQTRNTNLASIMAGQESIFKARTQSIGGQVAILIQRISQLKEEIKGLKLEVASQEQQIQLIQEEIRDVSSLLKKGLARKPRLLLLKRQHAEIGGARGKNISQIARVRQSIGETHLRITDLKTEMINEVVQQHRDVQLELFDLTEQLNAARDILARSEIRAPIDGTVVGLKVHTQGGVILPGAPLMDIVPSNDRLVVEARVNPSDIDIVRAGLPARVTLTAFSQRSVAPLKGKVVSVSADRLTNDRSGEPYYLVRVELVGDISKALQGASLYPGMQAEVMIVTGAHTALDYFLKPITQSLNRAFREN
jgi:HlyD family type I secretion membrane fusion protein